MMKLVLDRTQWRHIPKMMIRSLLCKRFRNNCQFFFFNIISGFLSIYMFVHPLLQNRILGYFIQYNSSCHFSAAEEEKWAPFFSLNFPFPDTTNKYSHSPLTKTDFKGNCIHLHQWEIWPWMISPGLPGTKNIAFLLFHIKWIRLTLADSSFSLSNYYCSVLDNP